MPFASIVNEISKRQTSPEARLCMQNRPSGLRALPAYLSPASKLLPVEMAMSAKFSTWCFFS